MSQENERKKLSKNQLRTVIVAAVSVVIVAALIITNFFIPVKYLFSYMVARNKGAAEGVMRVRFVDVGYGDCTIVELPDGKNMLIDAGDGLSSNQSRILKFLNQCDIDTIDYLICTSVNAEHCGGLTEIMQFKKVGTIFMPYCANSNITDEYRNFALSVSLSGINPRICQYGEGVTNSEYGYSFTFLSPSIYSDAEGWYAQLGSNPQSLSVRNNASAVMWLEYSGTSILFTSDAEGEALTQICNSYNLLLQDYPVKLEECNIIKVANHGAKASACVTLFDLVKPETAIITVGENAKGCPSAETMSNAVNYVGTNLYRTDEHGTVTVEITDDGYSVV